MDLQARLCPFCLRYAHSERCQHCGKDVNYSGYPSHLPVGYAIAGKHTYVIGASLGQGGFGITYIALDTDTNQRVAIKEYYPAHCSIRENGTTVFPGYNQEETFSKGKQHFILEAQMLQSLSDLDSVVKVLDYFEANSSAYLVMEYLDGLSLKDHVEKNGKLPAQQFLNQMNPLMADMDKMHRRGVVHRDIAPDNIILLPDGRLKLIDFGAARSYVGDKSMTVVVKKGFAPVEQYMRKGSNASTDVYALAATIYYCITGIVPPDSAERQYGEAILQAPSSLGVDVSAVQEQALEKALEIQPKERFQNVSEFRNALFNNWSAVSSVPQSPSASVRIPQPAPAAQVRPDSAANRRTSSIPKKKRARKWIPAVLISLLLVFAACGIFFYQTGAGQDTRFYGEVHTLAQSEDITVISTNSRPLQGFWGQHFYKRYRVKSISFIHSLQDAPHDALDVSAAKDRSILMWLDDSHLYVASEGIIAPPADASFLFYEFSNLEKIDFGRNFDTSGVTNMRCMFASCPKLTELNLSSFNTSNVQDMSSMFSRDTALHSLNLSSFDTSNVRTLNRMFFSCNLLNRVDLSDFNISNVTDMDDMFLNCPADPPSWYHD